MPANRSQLACSALRNAMTSSRSLQARDAAASMSVREGVPGRNAAQSARLFLRKMSPAAPLTIAIFLLPWIPAASNELALAFLGAAVWSFMEARKGALGSRALKAAVATRSAATVPFTEQRLASRSCSEAAITSCDSSSGDDGEPRESEVECTVTKLGLITPTKSSLSLASPAPSCRAAPADDRARREKLVQRCRKLWHSFSKLVDLADRWAEDFQAVGSEGQLTHYAWATMIVYFLQVGTKQSAMLPPLPGTDAEGQFPKGFSNASAATSTNEMFVDLLHFYASRFDWQNEAVILTRAHRASAPPELQQHVVMSSDQLVMDICPSIEDLFTATRNLSNNMHIAGLWKLREEIMHADFICSTGVAPPFLLKRPWEEPDPAVVHEEQAPALPMCSSTCRCVTACGGYRSHEVDTTHDGARSELIEDSADEESNEVDEAPPFWVMSCRTSIMLWLLTPHSGIL